MNNTNNKVTNSGFAYDAAGNLTADGSAMFTWNAERRMDSTAGYKYIYDGDGRRVEKVSTVHVRTPSSGRNPSQQARTPNGKLYWYGLGGAVLFETDLSGNIQYDYIYFSGQRIARRTPAGTVHFYLSDRLGSARVMTTATGTVVEESDFYPYGGERVITDTLDNTYKFTGHERDGESGLDHTLYRQYSSSLGRWHSPDPLLGGVGNPQTWNRYSYAGNSPCNNVDRDGRYFDDEGVWHADPWNFFGPGDFLPDVYRDVQVANPIDDLQADLGVNGQCATALNSRGHDSKSAREMFGSDLPPVFVQYRIRQTGSDPSPV